MGSCRVVRAIILAAGASTRMGQPKAALTISHPRDTFLSRIIRSLTSAGLPDIVVVTGAAAEVVRPSAGRVDRHVSFVHNARWEDGQLSSLLVGLGDSPLEAALVTLVDVPFVSPETIARVLHAWRSSRAPIVRPARGDQHGHPVVFDRAVFKQLHEADRAVGAKSVVRAHTQDILNVPIDDPGAFLDVDTQQDYATAIGGVASQRQSRVEPEPAS